MSNRNPYWPDVDSQPAGTIGDVADGNMQGLVFARVVWAIPQRYMFLAIEGAHRAVIHGQNVVVINAITSTGRQWTYNLDPAASVYRAPKDEKQIA